MTDTGTVGILPTSEGADLAALLREREIRFERQLIDLDDIDADASTRNQARLLPVHQETVEIYRAAMAQGDRFPPIVVNASKKPYVILDGNHRLFAAKMAGFTSMEALLVKSASQSQMELFTYEANAKHGLPTSLEERIKQGIYLVSLGHQALIIAKALSIPERRLWEAIGVAKTEKRLGRLGFTDADRIQYHLKRRIGSIRSDVVLLPFAEIIVKAGLGSSEVNDLVVKINKLATESDQVAFVNELRVKYDPVIKSTAGGALDLPRDVVRLRMAARLLRNIDESALQDSIDRTAPEFRSVIAREVIESVSALLTASKILRSHEQG